MITTGFFIGQRDWWVMANFGVAGTEDLNEVFTSLLAGGCPDDDAQKACMVLSRPNSGFTFTNTNGHFTLMFASRADSPEEMYDTIDHELKHCVEHISTYYAIDPKSEEAAYLQGEISKNLFPAVSAAVCPICNNEKGEER